MSDPIPSDAPTLALGGAVRSGAVAGLLTVVAFAALHQVLISDIWFSIFPMALAGAVCGGSLAWTYASLFPRREPGSWFGYVGVYLALLLLLGAASVALLDPVASMAELITANEPPGPLIAEAMPLTVGYSLAATVVLSRMWGRTLRAFGSIALTTALLVALLGLNVSVLGLVEMSGEAVPVLGEFFGLLALIMLGYGALFAALERRGLFAVIVGLFLLVAATPARAQDDWANLQRYREANAELGPPTAGEERVVFYGNSITDAWARHFPEMFPDRPYVGRGISGQTTPQMLVRFRQDVVALEPSAVVILAGTNDIAGNTGPSTIGMIADNLRSMAEIALANGIAVVLASVLPAYEYPWRPGLAPAPKIIELNAWIRGYAELTEGVVYLDYHSAMADERGGLPEALAYDGVHPTDEGYRVMAPLAEAAIREGLGR